MNFLKKLKSQAATRDMRSKAEERIAALIVRAQRSFADFMNARTRQLSVKKLKLLLGIVCLAGSLSFGYIALSALAEKHIGTIGLSIEKIRPPGLRNIIPVVPAAHRLLSPTDYQRIEKARQFMDSLYRSDRKTFDSITASRPGLMDSLAKMETLYNNNK